MSPGRLGPLLGLLAACGGGGDTGGFSGGTASGGDDTGDGPPSYDCPAGMVEIAGGTFSLGESDADALETWRGTIIQTTTVRVSSFCVDEYPLPNREGAVWPADGLSWDQVAELEALLPTYGRRLCTAGELMLAAAGPDNWRYPWDNNQYQADRCDLEAGTPSPMGTYADCVSPTGVRDFMVRSAWVVLDPAVYASLRPQWDNDFPGDGAYAIYGGTAATDTFFAPSNYGIHFYGPGDPSYRTDGLRVCAATGALDPGTEAAWQARMDALASAGNFADWLTSDQGR